MSLSKNQYQVENFLDIIHIKYDCLEIGKVSFRYNKHEYQKDTSIARTMTKICMILDNSTIITLHNCK